jgi:aldose 1-epimerase
VIAMRAFCLATLALITVFGAGCDKPPAPTAPSAKFGVLADGTVVDRYALGNKTMQVDVLTFGGVVSSIRVPDRNGTLADVVLGYDSLDEYVRDTSHFGGIIGRYANRIAGARFTLDGQSYTLAANDGRNTLHGGTKSFDKDVWHAEPFAKPNERGVVLTRTSPDMEQGFPGALSLTVTYTLTDANELVIDYAARTDRTTVVNLTNHSYFNLAGEGSGDVLKHLLQLNAAKYTPVDATLIPTGQLASVVDTPFDFRAATAIGARIAAENPQLALGKGYDHNFVVDRARDTALMHVAHVEEPTTGRVLDVFTTEPGVQLYTANHLDGSVAGKQGHQYTRNAAFCLETQHFPDSPNQPAFPATTLGAGQEFRSRTIYRFSVH